MLPAVNFGIFYFPFLIQNKTAHARVKGRLRQKIICL